MTSTLRRRSGALRECSHCIRLPHMPVLPLWLCLDRACARRLRTSSSINPFSAMADRYFQNFMPDFDEGLPANSKPEASSSTVTNSLDLLLREPFPTLSEKFLKAALSLKDEVVQATCSNSAKRQRNFSIYTGTLGTAFLCFRAHQTAGNLDDLNLCREIIKEGANASGSIRQCPTFLLGMSGMYALGAVAAKCGGDHREVDYYVKLLGKVGEQSALACCTDDRNDIPYELLYGRAGYVWAVLFMNKQLGYEAVPTSVLMPILDAIFASGRARGSKRSCPLMFQWHSKAYWGAAHGLAGIMHCLLHFSLKDEDAEAVKSTLKYMIQNRFPESRNYRSSEGNTEDKLVQWCHGAPGVSLTLCKAAEVFPDESIFEKAALEAGELVWRRGLLRKIGICHGISGNAYSFLALHRVFGGSTHLHRAKAFGCFLLEHGRKLIASNEMHGGDHPYSLYEGLAGTACLWLDLVNPQRAKFPGYEV